MNPKTKAILRELKNCFSVIYGDRLVNLVLFGSQARGDADICSDIDVLVILRGVVNPGEEIAKTSEIRAELSLKYDVVISCIFISEHRYQTEQSPLMINVRREGAEL